MTAISSARVAAMVKSISNSNYNTCSMLNVGAGNAMPEAWQDVLCVPAFA